MRNSVKLILIILGVIFVAALVRLGVVYWKNIRGLVPAFEAPPADIAELLEGADAAKKEEAQKTAGQTAASAPTSSPPVSFPLTLQSGFSIGIFAKGLGKPRVMAWDPGGALLVSIPDAGKVVALRDTNNDGVADETYTVVRNLNKPHGLAFRCADPAAPAACQLYIAESHQVAVYEYDAETLEARDQKKLVALPDGGNHFTRTIMFLLAPREDELLISVGSSCNVCDEDDELRAAISVFNIETNELKTFARGLRNSVFMALHPVTGAVWATEMGRDLIGDDLPPDEINIVKEEKHYGWPLCYGKNILDTDFHKNDHQHVRPHCTEPFETPSYIDLPAHSAPLGLAFFPEEGWPEDFWFDALVAYHGSWNRTVPTGYKVVRVRLDLQGTVKSIEDFITGWLTREGKALGRPVDILIQPGGVIFISDDKAGVIYRVTFQKPRQFALKDMVRNVSVRPDDVIASPLEIKGEARGLWYFEGNFPVSLVDENKKVVAQSFATAQGEWMTTDFVSFRSTITFEQPSIEKGVLILQQDDPAGFGNPMQWEIPVRFRASTQTTAGGAASGGAGGGRTEGECVISGCSGEICSDEKVITTCEFKPEFACYEDAVCAKLEDGKCGWVLTEELTQCLRRSRGSIR